MLHTVISSLTILLCLYRVDGLFTITNHNSPSNPIVTYKRFSASWTINLPSSFNADVLAPQLCALSNSTCKTSSDTQHVTCEQLAEIIRNPAWHAAPVVTVDKSSCPDILSNWDNIEKRYDAQSQLGAPYNSIRALPPASVDIASAGDFLPLPNSLGAIDVLLRVIFITHTGNGFAVHQFSYKLVLEIPRDLTGAVLHLQHECSRQGLRSPPLSSLVLSWASGRPFCLWQCRPDHVRFPWNSPPPTKQINMSSIYQTCRLLPEAFTAIEFEIHVVTALVSPVPSQLSASVLSELDDIGIIMENILATSNTNIVMLKATGSIFDDVAADSVIKRHVFTMGKSDDYEILTNQDFALSGARRRLLTDNNYNGIITCTGVLFTSDTQSSPAHHVQNLQSLSVLANQELTVRPLNTLQTIRNVQVLRLHRLITHSRRRRSLLASTFQDYMLIFGSVAIVLITILVIFLHCKRKNKPSTTQMSYAK